MGDFDNWPGPADADEERHTEEFDDAVDVIQAKVEEACRADDGCDGVVVQYAAYGRDDRGMPVDNLDDVAVVGRVRLFLPRYPWRGSRVYLSCVLTSPTWLQVAVCANRAILKVADPDHVFLEMLMEVPYRFRFIAGPPDETWYRLHMGS